MSVFFDSREARSFEKRTEDNLRALSNQISIAKQTVPYYREAFAQIDTDQIKSLSDLTKLDVLRKSDLMSIQAENSPFGDLNPLNKKFDYVFQSPGPIYEPGSKGKDWWRIARFLYALGIGKNDILQNCFSYHFTPAGAMLESGALALGASVFPAGTGNTEQQAMAAAAFGTTAYCGTPEYLLTVLKKASELELDLSKLTKAAVSGGPLFPNVRAEYQERGIKCLQAYATAELGLIAYETEADEPMIVDEGVIVEVVTPGTGNPVKPGVIGEVLVTLLGSDFPLFRFATGDLSMIVPGESACGRTNTRIAGWRGRADQAAKVRGMFVRPEQVAKFQSKHPEVLKVRIVINLRNSTDVMTTKLEISSESRHSHDYYFNSIKDSLKLKTELEILDPETLPNDGLVIEDLRPSVS
ncbi:MAG: AMP-binding protein [Pseudomonadota bacterium]|nr:AMP-binding protein [Pseudomonadota bacterium]